MSIRTSTKYQVNQYSNICVNPDCPSGLPRYKGFGKPAHRKCSKCGASMRRIQGESRGTRYSR